MSFVLFIAFVGPYLALAVLDLFRMGKPTHSDWIKFSQRCR